ncbi:MAG TPA: Dabb family protein [Fibrobacteraceae bacterium]|jgi:hypothetical protein|nr:Dabb family protein [Fibrobacter sp.]HOG69608.1 Dabb family protein [Fibrobacteraceae bacterium]HPW94023.1 Dabb family protein [Fibrobacteraceae bacterium]
MIKHIVLWKMKDNAEGASAIENATKIVDMLHDLKGKIPSLISIEAGIDFNRSGAAWDLALYSSFQNTEDLNNYQIHPEHQKVATFIRAVTEDRCVVDFEI